MGFFMWVFYRTYIGDKTELSRSQVGGNKILIIGYFLGQQADKKRDSDVRNGNEMVTGMKAKYTQNLYKMHLSLAYVKKK